jgi:2'-5' RNA ligase
MDKNPQEAEEKESSKNKIDIGIAFLLNKEVTDKSFEIAEKLENAGLKFIFSLEEYPPHISIFQGAIFSKDLEKIREKTDELADILEEGLEMQMEPKLFLNERNGNIFWNVKKSDKLQKVHEIIFEKIAPITNGKVMAQFEKLLEYPDTPEEIKERLKKYGAMFVGPYFFPHITIGRLQTENITNEKAKKILETINLPEISFKYYLKDIVSCKLDNFGRITI